MGSLLRFSRFPTGVEGNCKGERERGAMQTEARRVVSRRDAR